MSLRRDSMSFYPCQDVHWMSSRPYFIEVFPAIFEAEFYLPVSSSAQVLWKCWGTSVGVILRIQARPQPLDFLFREAPCVWIVFLKWNLSAMRHCKHDVHMQSQCGERAQECVMPNSCSQKLGGQSLSNIFQRRPVKVSIKFKNMISYTITKSKTLSWFRCAVMARWAKRLENLQ